MKTYSQLRTNVFNESVLLYASKKPTEDAQHPALNNKIDATYPFDKVASSFHNNTSQTFKLNDGTTIQITPVEAKNIMYTYEELNDANQGIFESMINDSIDTYSLIVEFCNNYIN